MSILRNHLRSQDPRLANEADHTWERSQDIHNRMTRPTDFVNGPDHMQQVENNLFSLLSRSRHDRANVSHLESLKPLELYLLSLAACCHDYDKGLPPDVLPRENWAHGEGSAYYIRMHWRELGIIDLAAAWDIASIVSVHGFGEDFADKVTHMEDAHAAVDGCCLDVKYLAVLLKVADVLHCDASRVSNLTAVDHIMLPRRQTFSWEVDGRRIRIMSHAGTPEERSALREREAYMKNKEWPPIALYLQPYGLPHVLELRNDTQDQEDWIVEPSSSILPQRRDLVGRTEPLNEIQKLIEEGRSVYIWGAAGVGKTSLALAVAWNIKINSRYRVIYYSFEGRATNLSGDRFLDLILDLCARSLGQGDLIGLELGQKEQEVCRHLGSAPVLVWLDGLEDTHLVSRLRLLAGSCRLLVTSRTGAPNDYDWLKPWNLGRMGRTSSVELFKVSYGKGLMQDDEVHINTVCNAVGDLPLAINICAHQARDAGLTIATLKQLLENLTFPEVEKALRLTYDRLDDSPKQFFASLSLFGGLTFSVEAAAVMWGDEGEATRLLMELVKFSLAEPMGNNRFSLHPLVQDFSANCPCERRAALENRMVNYFQHFAESNRTQFDALDRDVKGILAAMKICSDKGDGERYAAFADAMLRKHPGHYAYGFLPERGSWSESIAIVDRCLQLTNDPETRAKLYEHRGLFYYWIGDHRNAELSYKQALELCRQENDLEGEAILYHRLGFISSDEGDYKKCEELYRESIRCAETKGDCEGTLVTGIHLLGVILYHQCRYEESREQLAIALARREESSDPTGVAVTKRRLAATYRRMGSLDKAHQLVLEALEIDQSLGHVRNIARDLRQLGMVYRDQGRIDEARKSFDESLRGFTEVGNKKGMASVLTNLGEIELTEGRLEQAEQHLNRSLEMAEQLKSRYGKAINLKWLATVSLKRENYRESIEQATRAMRSFESIQHIHVEDLCQKLNSALLHARDVDSTSSSLVLGEPLEETLTKYEELWAGAERLLEANSPGIDEHLLNLERDQRLGLSLILRPSEEIIKLLTKTTEPLRETAPEQYYYAPKEYHVTVATLQTAKKSFKLEDYNLQGCIDGLSTILANHRPFRIQFRGIGGTASCLFAQGFYSTGTLDSIRKDIKARASELRIEGEEEERYHSVNAHMSFLRFRDRSTRNMLVRVKEMRTCNLGILPVVRIDLVLNDWYVRQDRTRVLHSFELR